MGNSVIVCNKFVFLHLHKSGGTFVNQMMSACIPYARQIGYHFPYSMLPENFRRLPVIGTVRNPWAYYVSWYSFQQQMKRPNALFMAVSNNNTLDFHATIFKLLSLNNDEHLLAKVSALLPTQFENKGLNLTQQCIMPINQSSIGFYSFLYNRLYQGSVNASIIKVEQLRRDFSAKMATLKVAPQPKIQAFLEQAPIMNASRHQTYQSYYSTALKNHIAELDSALIDSHGYSF